MVTTQDASIGLALESTYRTGVTPTRWLEFVDESLDWNKNIKQGAGLRVGSRVARSARRVVPSADGGGDISVEAISKGMGLLWQLCLGAATSTLVSGTTYQQVFTLGDTPGSATIQKGTPQAGGTVDALTFLGCMVDSWELSLGNADVAQLKATIDAGDVTTATAYTSPTAFPPSTANLFHFANASIASGVLTAPTATTLASGTTTIADLRDFSVACDNGLRDDRLNIGGAGRKSKPIPGLRSLTGKVTAEYDVTTWRDAVLNETPMALILNFVGGSLSTGVEQLQVVLPEVKFDSELPKTNGPDLITESMSFVGLDNLTAAQPIWVVARTSDTAL